MTTRPEIVPAPCSSPNDESRPWLAVRGLTKTFGGVAALKGVDLELRRGRVHGLVGANGAGKSTLIRSLAGVITPDSGSIEVEGRPVTIGSPADATRLGLAFIHQELNLVPRFNGMRNMALGLPVRNRAGIIDWRPTRQRAQEVAERLGITFPLTTPAEDLTVAEQWLLVIARALMRDATFIAMDEPTASLSATESERLLQVVRDLVGHDVAVVYVSHRLEEIVELCDEVTVFKDGEVVHRAPTRGFTQPELVRVIVGRELAPDVPHQAHVPTTTPVLETRDLRRGTAVRGVDLTLHAGEVLGLAGLVGSGRTELVRLLFGADSPDAGQILLDGEPVRFRSPADAVRRGLALVPEERRAEGLFLDKSVEFNVTVATTRNYRFSRFLPLSSRRRAKERTRQIIQQLQIKAADVDQPVGKLSGGNQQKVVLGRWLACDPRVLLLDELSRGVDVGARSEIHRIVRSLADDGKAVIAISSELEELVGLCDRVLVLAEGRVVAALVGDHITTDRMVGLSYAGGGKPEGSR